MPDVRVLGPGDEAAYEAFLRPLADSSMFLRANVRAAGFLDRGEFQHGTYAAAVVDTAIVAVAGHAWNGMVMLQAPRHLSEVARAVVRASGRPVTGLSGPWEQVDAARAALGLAAAPSSLDSKDLLMALSLAELAVPPALAAGEVAVRRAEDCDLDVLVDWRAAYYVETLGATDSPELRARLPNQVRQWMAGHNYFVLERGDEPVACTAFNARLPDVVQVGGVWTPPVLRRRGYARAAVAGSLLAARAGGVNRAILFTDEAGWAQHPYAAIGFRTVGDYGLVLFDPDGS